MNPAGQQHLIDDLNKELDQLLYAISHDLRAPLRAIDGFSQAVAEDYEDALDETGKDYLNRVRRGCANIEQYIEGLLFMSRETRGELDPVLQDMSALVVEVNKRLSGEYNSHAPRLIVQEGVEAVIDRQKARTLLTKLLDNAWKFSFGVDEPVVEFGRTEVDGREALFVRDNGVGFDMEYARERLFGAFQRMHPEGQFEGLGTGLATARRIINRHRGEIWAESEVGKGTTIYFRVDGE